MVVCQGDIFWAFLGRPIGSEPGYRHPIVIIQSDIFNNSAINTVVACLLTSKLHRADSPGNVLLLKGEANLPRQSVVNVSQIVTVDKFMLSEKIGTLPKERLFEILRGVHLLINPRSIEI